ncbi:MAG: LysE family translocator [Hyphomicrobiales bacterium]|nr:LysE family translocator [Hyphomicrobiales bacterium]MCP5370422.1 LysE family translocator [Hyphomicrobiales bacterium]
MTTASFLALSLALAVMAVVPGPGVFAVLARALGRGFAPAAVLAAGIIAGDLVWLTATLLGLGYLAAEFTGLFQAVKVAGGLYLVYLGVRLWRAAPATSRLAAPNGGRSGALATFLGGLTTTLGNPKVMVFYAAFFPAFVDMAHLTAADTAAVAALAAAVPLAVLLAYAALAARVRRLFTAPAAVRRLNRGAGTVMIATGAVVATR